MKNVCETPTLVLHPFGDICRKDMFEISKHKFAFFLIFFLKSAKPAWLKDGADIFSSFTFTCIQSEEFL